MDGLALEQVLDEKSRRLLAAAVSKAWGRGGIPVVSKATGVSRQVIRQGRKELEQSPPHSIGRKKARQKDTSLVAGLEKLVEPATRGAPESCLRWTCKSVRKLAEELEGMGHQVSYPVVAELLHGLAYSLRTIRKTTGSIRGMSRQGRNVLFWTGSNADRQPPFPPCPLSRTVLTVKGSLRRATTARP